MAIVGDAEGVYFIDFVPQGYLTEDEEAELNAIAKEANDVVVL
jgi:mannose/fructose-specific phosphotransferase system component IIA